MAEDNVLTQIIDLIERNGGRYVLAENGKPEYVVMKMEEYERLVEGNKERKSSGELSKKDLPDFEMSGSEDAPIPPEEPELIPEEESLDMLVNEILQKEGLEEEWDKFSTGVEDAGRSSLPF